MTDKPRILLLTPAAPDFPYAGNAFLRKIVAALDGFEVLWCSLAAGSGRYGEIRHIAVPAAPRHWRLRGTLADYLWMRAVSARRRAGIIAEEVAGFRPTALWVLAEDEAVNVGYHLADRLGVRLHLTFHDAPEVYAKKFSQMSRWAAPLYLRRVAGLVRKARGIDAVSSELVQHVLSRYSPRAGCVSFCFPPSVSAKSLEGMSRPVCYDACSGVRRIGLCGSMRVSDSQWQEFLGAMERLPHELEIVVYSDKDYFPSVPVPTNVRVVMKRYASTETELISEFLSKEVHACYLGLWKDVSYGLFCRTSLSSKLATYAAAGLPVIVDGPRDSVAWRLVGEYGAGVLLADGDATAALGTLFGNAAEWRRFSDGVAEMWKREFDLDANAVRFAQSLRARALQRN